MACVKCNGVWQCSTGGDPCGMSGTLRDNEKDKKEKWCLTVYTKKDKGECKMKIKCQSDPAPDKSWHEAGQVCLDFEVLTDKTTGDCFVRVTPA